MVAFSARYDIPFESEELQEQSAWVQEVTREVVEKEYEGWGPDATAIVKCMPEKPNKCSIHVVYPALESFSKGRVALIGDAVRCSCLQLLLSIVLIQTVYRPRHTRCSLTLELEQGSL